MKERDRSTTATLTSAQTLKRDRPRVDGKFLAVGDERLYIRGVTYGPLCPQDNGDEYDPVTVERDFQQMTSNEINAVRLYTVPPRWLLDLAHNFGLWVMVGFPWEQHIAFLDDRRRASAIVNQVRAAVRSCACHPAILCFAIGNEIPSSIVRWSGARQVEQFLQELTDAVRAEDPEALVTYVNYPSTEYLRLPFIDFVSFNVYLENQPAFEGYLLRLQNLAGDRPLLLAEIGLDSLRNGELNQAATLEWQTRSAFAMGGAGVFVFSWTDEWYRGGAEILDWDFGLTNRGRAPKPALVSVSQTYEQAPFPDDPRWPMISVVVCSYNGSRTIRDCMEGLKLLNYPNFETIVVDDGSTDETASIVREYNVNLIQTKNQGLSNARNAGMTAARGEIVAYTDDDARPDPNWLNYLAATFLSTNHVAVGGPNIAPAGDGPIAECVANSPGGPAHVLITDELAEHLPGCNLAIRRECLVSIGGFDPRFRSAGDDVDVCWRLQDQGGTLGFSPAAMVWHHRRNSIRAYWRQQLGYGKAEALLESKWPARYNPAGHVTWHGRIYGNGLTQGIGSGRSRIYQGVWGTAPFQAVYPTNQGFLASLPLMPEWFFVIAALALLSMLGLLWTPLLVAVPLLVLAVAAPIVQAVQSAARVPLATRRLSRWGVVKRRVFIAGFHLIQPVGRLRGRWRFGLTPWRSRSNAKLRFPTPRTRTIWSEQWRSPEERLTAAQKHAESAGGIVLIGQTFDRWDIEIKSGLFGSARMLSVVEEHGSGNQLRRFRIWPHSSGFVIASICVFAVLSLLALLDRSWIAGGILALSSLILALRVAWECSAAEEALITSISHPGSIDDRDGEATCDD
jgi:GT2 family glycosyltransferase